MALPLRAFLPAVSDPRPSIVRAASYAWLLRTQVESSGNLLPGGIYIGMDRTNLCRMPQGMQPRCIDPPGRIFLEPSLNGGRFRIGTRTFEVTRPRR